LGPLGITLWPVAQFLGEEKKRCFSDFGMYAREFPKAESGKSFVSSLSFKIIEFFTYSIIAGQLPQSCQYMITTAGLPPQG
jgi:hypothetical protein